MDPNFVDSLGPHSHTLSSGHHHNHSHGGHDSEWEAKEQLRLRELEEARTRAAQMEKTMRWWSDCTANWREKWSKVRTERNKAREDVRILRTKFESASKEISNLKREKLELDSELQRLKTGNKLENFDADAVIVPERDISSNSKRNSTISTAESTSTATDLQMFNQLFQTTVGNDDDDNDDQLSLDLNRMVISEKRTASGLWEDLTSPDIEFLKQRNADLELRLEETMKTLQMEREENTSVHKSYDKVQQELTDLKFNYEELKALRQETLKELSQMKLDHQDEVNSIRFDLEDESNTRTSLDRKIAELRTQLERLQSENASEWGKRERLETDKLNLERENKKYRLQIEELQERLERKPKSSSSSVEVDARSLQRELSDKNKELNELKHTHCKLKKVLQEKSTELSHASRRAEQYENEVKKLRGRIEELKKELATAEDEIDSSTNSLRKMQRSNEELQEQVDNLQVQVDHLQTRLRNHSHSLLALSGSNCLLNDGLSEDDNADF